MSELKRGTVCYLVRLPEPAAYLNGRVVTLTGETLPTDDGTRRAYVFDRPLENRTGVCEGTAIEAVVPEHLLPISDPDQPVNVTSDTDEPVTA